ncbi:MAG: hypothetical protein HZA25_00880 [Candidatus Niyogibacteria bacterium]|nr:hypothetical protein [Candidatus Niyogibacteria bacterium]
MGSKRSFAHKDIYPDEIFLDSKNIPGFREESFEGVIEQAIARRTPIIMTAVFILVFLALMLRAGELQIARGEEFFARAQDNSLRLVPLDPVRGAIYDRRGTELAWSVADGDRQVRTYSSLGGLGHLLGYVGYPTDLEVGQGLVHDRKYGRSGIEKTLDGSLRGVLGERLIEVDSKGAAISESAERPPTPGDSVILTIDAELQSKLYEVIAGLGAERGFEGGAGVALDPRTGEVLAITSWPEYDSNAMSSGDAKKIAEFAGAGQQPFFFRAVSGLYAPGSIVKPIVALAALKEGVIDEFKQIFSAGFISIPNPYDPEHPSVFKDWKAHGLVDMRHAITVSSDVYFYSIGGGYGDVRGLGVTRLKQYYNSFGMGEKTGIDIAGEEAGFIPSPAWKEKTFADGVWRLGDTYNMSIGQGYIQVTPIQMAVAAATIANDGRKIVPHVLKEIKSANGTTIVSKTGSDSGRVEADPALFKVIREGMEMAAEPGGTAQALAGLSVKAAGKTGTAEVGSQKKHVNSWIISFLPYDAPKFALVIVMERGDIHNLVGAPAAARRFLDWVTVNRPEYFK